MSPTTGPALLHDPACAPNRDNILSPPPAWLAPSRPATATRVPPVPPPPRPSGRSLRATVAAAIDRSRTRLRALGPPGHLLARLLLPGRPSAWALRLALVLLVI